MLSLSCPTADWKLKANLNIIASQLGETVYDLEWNNGTSFIFKKSEPACKVLTFEVGILYPDWLSNATYLGQGVVDTFITNAWTKAEFINYYADQATNRPVSWTFLSSNAEFHVLEWVEGATLPEKEWQAPPYCFIHPNGSSAGSPALEGQVLASGRMYRLRAAQLHEAAAERQQVRRSQQQQVQQQLESQPVQSS
eukprot:gene6608-6836_t